MTQDNHANNFSLDDVVRSYRWLDHSGAFTELVALHPDYKPGMEHREWNRKHKTYPITRYAQTEQQVIRFVQQYHGTRQLNYGHNPRHARFVNEKGYPRATREEDIRESRNVFIDIDITDKTYLDEKLASLDMMTAQFHEYFQDLGLQKPVVAAPGQGCHLLFAHPAITVADCPDISRRIKKFQHEFRDEFRNTLSEIDAVVDCIYDLRRMVKIYGSAKKKTGRVSRFYGETRQEDAALRDYLLALTLDEETPVIEDTLSVSGLPPVVRSLLDRDEKLRQLWNGQGKQSGTDTSRSGYDYSVVQYLLKMGVDRISDLEAAIALRPDGGVRGSGKGKTYLRHTIANAILHKTHE